MSRRTARLTFVFALAFGCAGADPLVVKVERGLIRGAMADAERRVRAFKGVAFAAPPVGPLRWKPPQAAQPWDGVRNCTRFGPACPQPRSLAGRTPPKQSEDCLTLNVWTAAKDADARLPVMVWIHGGGCTTGAGSQSYYDGAALARQGVVVVTINYRLGPFGFFAHPLLSKESDKGVSGNYGLLDQIAALRWVQTNIAAFGGEPGRVTIFGESAGALSVCRLMVSPLAKGLFHRAIAQSGGAHGRNRHLREQRGRLEPMEKLGERLAARLGCEKAADPLAALRAKTPEEILKASTPAQGLFGRGDRYGPIIDGWALPEDPVKVFEEGRQHDVPFLAGSNADEGTLFLRQLPIKRPIGYRLVIRSMFREHASAVLKLFPAQRPEDVQPAINRFITVSAFAAPMRFLARAMGKVDSKAYLYHFTRVPPLSRARKMGAFHGLEIAYVFGNLRQGAGWEEKDRALSKAMSAAWVRFAATGDPNGEGLPEWPPYDAATDQHMELGDELGAKSGLYREACDLFDKIQSERAAGKP